MKKETLKTIILTLLIFSSVILSIQIWFVNPAWTQTYSLASFFTAWKPEKDDGLNINVTGAFNSVFSPRAYVFTYNDGRLFFSTTEQEGSAIRDVYNTAIKTAFSAENAVFVTENDWQTMLKSNSIYADYSVPVSINALFDFLGGTTEPSFALTSFNQTVITFDQILTNAYICFRNSTTNQQMRITLTDAQEIRNIFEQYKERSKEDYAYAFEMNLDKKMNETAVQQKVLMNSYILVPLEPVTMNTIRREAVTFSQQTIDGLLELFGYNPKTARKFTESNGTILFVDNKSTLKLNSETGYVEYIAEKDDGLALPGDGNLSSIASGCGKLLDNIYNLFVMDPNVTLFINSPLDTENAERYTITFDYLFNGNSIQNDTHSCKIVVSGGEILEFYATIKNYQMVAVGNQENAQDVLDTLYTNLNQDALLINNLYTGYIDAPGEMPLCWRAEVQGSDEIITVK